MEHLETLADQVRWIGAGDENRTRMTSLEGWGSTIELHPHEVRRGDRTRTCGLLLPKQAR